MNDRCAPGRGEGDLPDFAGPLIGREREVAAVQRLVARADARLLTLTGAGGIGKTRLAVEAARRADRADGVRFVPLATVGDAGLVGEAVARACGLLDVGGAPAWDRAAAALRERAMLLVLDNVEHVIDVAPRLVDLLAACPRLTILATSRMLLNVSVEHRFPVPPLAVPSPGERAGDFPAVELFVRRAQAADPGFVLNEANAGAVAEVCTRLDGLPLAIELAAAWTRHLSPAALLAQFDRAGILAVLTRGARDLPERQRTLRRTLEWSYRLLDEEERGVLRRLSVFAGGGELEAAAAVCGMDVLVRAASLADKSLLELRDRDGVVRLTMPRTIREYARDELGAAHEGAEMQGRHARYYAELVEQARAHLGGAEQRGWLDRLEGEHDNVRAAFQWAVECGDADLALRLASSWEFALLRGHLGEGRCRVEAALALGGETERHGEGLCAACYLAIYEGDYSAARRHGEEGVELAREAGDDTGLAAGLTALGLALHLGGPPGAAGPVFGESIALHRARGDRAGLARVLLLAGVERRLAGGMATAGQAGLAESLLLYRELGDRWGASSALHALGSAALARREYEAAEALFREGLAGAAAIDHRVLLMMHLDGLASAAAGQGQPAEALRLVAVADAAGERVGVVRTPSMQTMRRQTLARAERELGEAAGEAIREAGRAERLEEVVAALTGKPIRGRGRDAGLDRLTRREIEILRVVAEGLSNAEAAARLGISPRTVDAHLVNVYGKLGVSSRAAATRYAVEHYLVAPGQTWEEGGRRAGGGRS